MGAKNEETVKCHSENFSIRNNNFHFRSSYTLFSGATFFFCFFRFHSLCWLLQRIENDFLLDYHRLFSLPICLWKCAKITKAILCSRIVLVMVVASSSSYSFIFPLCVITYHQRFIRVYSLFHLSFSLYSRFLFLDAICVKSYLIVSLLPST